MTYNSGDRKDIRRAEKYARSSDAETKIVLQNLTSTAMGRRWLWEKLTAAHVFETSFLGDAEQMLFREGERNAGLALLGEIMQYVPQTFTTMMQEHQERNLPDGRADTSDADRSDSDEPSDDAAGDLAYAPIRVDP